jgi:hypothetical protein
VCERGRSVWLRRVHVPALCSQREAKIRTIRITGHSPNLSPLKTDSSVLKAQFTGSGLLIDILLCVSHPLTL